MRAPSTAAGRALIVALLALAPPVTAPVQSQALSPTTSVMTVPFSGTLVTGLEEISVSGVMRIQVESRLARRTMFSKIRTSISQTVGLGATSQQAFVGVGTSLNTCSIPASSRSDGRFPLEFVSQHRLVAREPVTAVYQHQREGPLPLIYEISLDGEGHLAGASVRVGVARVRAAKP
jgi:hypothetical protein